MDLHNEKNNQKHLHLVIKYFAEENRCLQSANKDLQLSNKELVLQNKKLQSEIKKLFDEIDKKMQVQNAGLKNHLSSFRWSVFNEFMSEESAKDVFSFGNEVFLFFRRILPQSQVKHCFDTKNFLSIAERLTLHLPWLEDYEDLLVELISSSSIIVFNQSDPINLFFKTKIFPKYDQGLIPMLNDSCSEIGPLRRFVGYRSYNILQVSKWDIKLDGKPIDLSQPDERFKLSNQPFI